MRGVSGLAATVALVTSSWHLISIYHLLLFLPPLLLGCDDRPPVAHQVQAAVEFGVPDWSSTATAIGAMMVAEFWLDGGVRWQLVPAWGSFAIALGSAIVAAIFHSSEPGLVLVIGQLLLNVLALCFSLLSLVLLFILPVPSLPPLPSSPTHPKIKTHKINQSDKKDNEEEEEEGVEAVGTMMDMWQVAEKGVSWDAMKKGEAKREEAKRNVFAKIWYPADAADPQFSKAPLAPYAVLKGNAIYGNSTTLAHLDPDPLSWLFPGFALLPWHTDPMRCNARYAAPISKKREKYPIIIYSHGQGTLPEKNTALCERLASRGYVVFAPYNDDFDKSWPGPMYRRQLNLRHLVKRIAQLNRIQKLSKAGCDGLGIEIPPRQSLLSKILSGIGCGKDDDELSRLRRLNREGGESGGGRGMNMFFGRLDVGRGIGLFGHSFGATTTTLMCCRGYQVFYHQLAEEEEEEKEKEDERQEPRSKKIVNDGERNENSETNGNHKNEDDKGKGKESETVNETTKSNIGESETKVEYAKEEGKGKGKEEEEKEKEKTNEKKKEKEEGLLPLPHIACGAALDSWMLPINFDSTKERSRELVVPLLFVNSDLWLSKPEHLHKQSKIIGSSSSSSSSSSPNVPPPAYVVTVKGTSHQNFTDWSFLVRCWSGLAWLTRNGRGIAIPNDWMREESGEITHLGPSDPQEVWYAVASLLETFFEAHLKRQEKNNNNVNDNSKKISNKFDDDEHEHELDNQTTNGKEPPESSESTSTSKSSSSVPTSPSSSSSASSLSSSASLQTEAAALKDGKVALADLPSHRLFTIQRFTGGK